MGKDKKLYLPQSGAGLTRYFDDYKESMTFKPEHVVIFIGGVIAVLVMARFMM